MIRSFADEATEDLFNGRSSRGARKAWPVRLWPVVRCKLDQVNRVHALNSLRVPPGNRLERLLGYRVGQYRIRSNEQCPICFRWEDGYADDVEVADYHYEALWRRTGTAPSSNHETTDSPGRNAT